MATFEEAIRCPRCDQPGEQKLVQPLSRGKKQFTLVCMNDRCRWFKTGWTVTRNADGSVPERAPGQKEYEGLDVFTQGAAERYLEGLKKELEAGEVRKPR